MNYSNMSNFIKGINMNQQRLIDDARTAGFSIQDNTNQIYIEYGSGYREEITDRLAKFTELVEARAIASMQGDSAPIGEIKLDSDNFKYIHWNAHHWTHILSVGDKIYKHPANLKSPNDEPTNLYQHEIMDRTHLIIELISSELIDNAGITTEQTNMAEKALDSLCALYQDAGKNSFKTSSELSSGGWINVDDKMPNNGDDVIALESDGRVYRLEFRENKEGKFWLDASGYYYHNVTHWIHMINTSQSQRR